MKSLLVRLYLMIVKDWRNLKRYLVTVTLKFGKLRPGLNNLSWLSLIGCLGSGAAVTSINL